MYNGKCLCGSVQYQYTGTINELIECHCLQCRQSNGSAFASVIPAQKAQFHLLQGQQVLKQYESSAAKFRVFCGNCGSPVYSYLLSLPNIIRLRAGLIIEDLPLSHASCHIFVKDKANWDHITDESPQYDFFKPAE